MTFKRSEKTCISNYHVLELAKLLFFFVNQQIMLFMMVLCDYREV